MVTLMPGTRPLASRRVIDDPRRQTTLSLDEGTLLIVAARQCHRGKSLRRLALLHLLNSPLWHYGRHY